MKFVLLLAFVSIALVRPWCIGDYDEYNNIVIDGDVYFASDKKTDIFGSCEDDSLSSVGEDHDGGDYEYPDADTSDEKTTNLKEAESAEASAFVNIDYNNSNLVCDSQENSELFINDKLWTKPGASDNGAKTPSYCDCDTFIDNHMPLY